MNRGAIAESHSGIWVVRDLPRSSKSRPGLRIAVLLIGPVFLAASAPETHIKVQTAHGALAATLAQMGPDGPLHDARRLRLAANVGLPLREDA